MKKYRTPSFGKARRIAASFGRTDHAAIVFIHSGGSADHLEHAQSIADYHDMTPIEYERKYEGTQWAIENIPGLNKIVSPIWGCA